jgi:hypothetical protein
MSAQYLHDLPADHRLRNVAIQDIDLKIRCRHTGTTRNPRLWKIRKETFNRLGESWRTNFDFIIQ